MVTVSHGDALQELLNLMYEWNKVAQCWSDTRTFGDDLLMFFQQVDMVVAKDL